jgi:hypothetical protein
LIETAFKSGLVKDAHCGITAVVAKSLKEGVRDC